MGEELMGEGEYRTTGGKSGVKEKLGRDEGEGGERA